MDSAKFDTVILDHLRQTLALAAGISEVQLLAMPLSKTSRCSGMERVD